AETVAVYVKAAKDFARFHSDVRTLDRTFVRPQTQRYLDARGQHAAGSIGNRRETESCRVHPVVAALQVDALGLLAKNPSVPIGDPDRAVERTQASGARNVELHVSLAWRHERVALRRGGYIEPGWVGV